MSATAEVRLETSELKWPKCFGMAALAAAIAAELKSHGFTTRMDDVRDGKHCFTIFGRSAGYRFAVLLDGEEYGNVLLEQYRDHEAVVVAIHELVDPELTEGILWPKGSDHPSQPVRLVE